MKRETFRKRRRGGAAGILKYMTAAFALALVFFFAAPLTASATTDISTGYQILYVNDDYSFQYTGSAVTPDFVVVSKELGVGSYEEYMEYTESYRDKYTLKKDTDYTVKYSNNVDAGTGTVTVNGKGDYSGTLTRNFQVIPAKTTLTKKVNSDRTVTITPGISVNNVEEVYLPVSDYTLTKGTEYKVKNGEVTITTKFLDGETGYIKHYLLQTVRVDYGNYYGKITVKSYNISKLPFMAPDKVKYTGKNKTITVSMNDAKAGIDYKIEYAKSKRVAIGTYKYTIKAIGNCVGSQSGSFKIVPKTPAYRSASRTATKATIKWKKVVNCTGYQVQLVKRYYDGDDYYYQKYKGVTLKGNTKLTKTFKSLKKSRYTHVRIRAYKVVNGNYYYGFWNYKKF